MIAALLSQASRPPDTALCSAVDRWFASLVHDRVRQQIAGGHLWTAPDRSAAAGGTVLHGWIDNFDQLRGELGCDSANPARIYDAAIARWADDADRHIIGNYAALTALPGARLRLARSPWNAPPLYYARHGGCLLGASLVPAFFALGMPRHLRKTAILDQLAMDHDARADLAQYEGIARVPLGTIVHFGDGHTAQNRWYDPSALPGSRGKTDEDYVEQAAQLIADAARAALKPASRPASKPAIALSGGLDSPIMADALMKCLPAEERLQGITFVPDPEYDVPDRPGTIADEWPTVQEFAAMHPQLDIHRADPAHGGVDYRFREITRITMTLNAGTVLFGPHHGVWDKARTLGVDWLFGADMGNQTFSADGRWASAELFRAGHWRQLARMLRSRRGDDRPMWRRMMALAILPHFPRRMRARIHGLFHRDRKDTLEWLSMLAPDAREAYRQRARARGSAPAWEGFTYPASRLAAAQRDCDDSRMEMADMTLALELHYGVRYRDVTAYRPLIEFCLSLPTDQFAGDGEERRLARRLAAGRMPEAQHRKALHGRHNVDWHVRMKRDLPRLRAMIHTMRSHPWLAAQLDLDRMQHMLDAFPDGPGAEDLTDLPYLHGLGRALLAAQFIALVEGRNDL